jgi:hypothetical protein
MFAFLDDAVSQCAERVQRLGGSVIRYRKDPPANADQIARVDRRFGGCTPPELLQLGLFANSFEFLWRIDRSNEPEVAGISLPFGQFAWEFSSLRPLNPRDYWWAEEIVAGEREGVWHQKTIIDCAADGDFLAYTIDPALPHVPVYCAKDGCGPSELILGRSLAEFFREWARIGFLSINEFYEWPRRTGLQTFDVTYFHAFEALLGTETRVA